MNTLTNIAPETAPAVPSDRDRATVNRANSQHSTGPKTEGGKSAIKLNAIKHGLYAHTVVLPTENAGNYELLGASLRNAFQPQNEDELELVQTLQDSRWFLARINALETNFYALTTDQHLDRIDDRFGGNITEDTRQALAQAAAFQTNARIFDQLSRARARVERSAERARKKLDAILDARPRPQHPAAFAPVPPPQPEPAQAAPAPTPAPSPSEPAGFVSPKSETPSKTAPDPNAPFVPTLRMPKFSGPLAKEHRRQWLRKHAKKTNSY